jgi:formate dehydrogenase major subunit
VTVLFTLDGREAEAAPGETIWQVATRLGTEVPHLCHLERPGYRPDGNCRACVVEIAGERVLAASCIRRPTPGMEVRTATERVRHARRMVFELLLADQPGAASRDASGGFARWARHLDVQHSRFEAEPRAPRADPSHPAMLVQLDACIQCGLCERACREVQHNDVIGLAHRGMDVAVVFDTAEPMGDSTCVACGECVQACPTGALLPKAVVDELGARSQAPESAVASVCPYCGVGCQVEFRVRDDAIVEVTGRDGPSNLGRLCVKGRFGFDYLRHPERLTVRWSASRARRRIPPIAATSPVPGRSSARRAGRRRCLAPRRACAASATRAARTRSPASARPRARTRRPISSRS